VAALKGESSGIHHSLEQELSSLAGDGFPSGAEQLERLLSSNDLVQIVGLEIGVEDEAIEKATRIT